MHKSQAVRFLLALKLLSFLFVSEFYFYANYEEGTSRVVLSSVVHLFACKNTGNLVFWNHKFETLSLASWRTSTKVTVKLKFKRSSAPTTLYSNSVSVFYPIIKLVHDIEINPGPSDESTGEKASKKINNVKIAHLNVRSLKHRDHFIQVKDIVVSKNFDVFTISETWLDHSVSNLEIEIPGYHIFRVDRQNKRGGGVCVYVRQSFKTEFISEISGISDTGFHQLWVKIQVRNLKSFLVCTTYRPPSTPADFIETDLGTSLTSAFLLNKPIYILGDMNCNLLQADLPESQVLMNFCRTYNLNQIVTESTRITDSTESLIDVILVSNVKQVLETKVLTPSISDHDLVYVVLRLKKQRSPATFVRTRSFKNYHPDKFLKDISTAPWSVVEMFDDPDDKLHAFNLIFNNILGDHAPVKTFRIRGRQNPYITDEIRELMKTRDNWKQEFKLTKDPYAWSAYKNFCREVKQEIRTAEKEFITQQIKNNGNNTNCIWKLIRSCIPKKSTSDKTYSKPTNIVADEFNHFFASVGQNTAKKVTDLAEQFNHDPDVYRYVPRDYPVPEQFSFNANVKPDEVERIINSMASNKAPGIDKISLRVIKDCLPAILPTITSIVNATFRSARFPILWKTAEVIPILKDGDHEMPSNNRPISLLPVLSKVCERVAHNQLTSYLTLNKRLTTKQSGNKKWNSTETSVIQTTDAILEGIDKKKLTATVLLDLSKAFDSINHDILIKKLQDVGLSPLAIEWFRSYLQSRYQVVRILTAISDPLPVTSGVPQGSILGPLLFSIYTNDLPNVPDHCSTQCYVDDTKLLLNFNIRDQPNAIDKLNQDLCKICSWTFSNQLLINPDKTKLIIFGSRAMTAKVEDFSLTLLGKDLKPVGTVKDLGVFLDSNLTYNDHVLSTVASCMSRLGQINRVKHVFDQKTLTIIINALVLNKLFYCSNVWCNTSESNLNKIQAVQNFACRIICNKRKYDHVTPLLKDLRWLPVRQQLYYRSAIMAFKCMTGCAPDSLCSRFIQRSDVTKRTTRNSQMLQIPLFKSATGQRTFYYRSVKLWNSLDPALKLVPTLKDFKRSLRRKIVDSFLISD